MYRGRPPVFKNKARPRPRAALAGPRTASRGPRGVPVPPFPRFHRSMSLSGPIRTPFAPRHRRSTATAGSPCTPSATSRSGPGSCPWPATSSPSSAVGSLRPRVCSSRRRPVCLTPGSSAHAGIPCYGNSVLRLPLAAAQSIFVEALPGPPGKAYRFSSHLVGGIGINPVPQSTSFAIHRESDLRDSLWYYFHQSTDARDGWMAGESLKAQFGRWKGEVKYFYPEIVLHDVSAECGHPDDGDYWVRIREDALPVRAREGPRPLVRRTNRHVRTLSDPLSRVDESTRLNPSVRTSNTDLPRVQGGFRGAPVCRRQGGPGRHLRSGLEVRPRPLPVQGPQRRPPGLPRPRGRGAPPGTPAPRGAPRHAPPVRRPSHLQGHAQAAGGPPGDRGDPGRPAQARGAGHREAPGHLAGHAPGRRQLCGLRVRPHGRSAPERQRRPLLLLLPRPRARQRWLHEPHRPPAGRSADPALGDPLRGGRPPPLLPGEGDGLVGDRGSVRFHPGLSLSPRSTSGGSPTPSGPSPGPTPCSTTGPSSGPRPISSPGWAS